MRLKGKVAVVTGAASGIGRATAILFGEEGARVMCADIDGDGVKLTARHIVDGGSEGAAIQVDVSQDADAQRMVRETVERWGRLDILFNNAGVEGPEVAVTDLSEEDWDHTIDVNLKGVFLGCKYAIPRMLKAGGGVIINNASVAGLRGIPMSSTYCSSKGGVVLLTKALAVEWGRQGIRVNCVCPGVILTPMVEREIDEELSLARHLTREEILERWGRAHPLGRVGTAEEVAKTVLFLASDDASFITGVALPVDGGWEAAGSPFS